MGYEYTTKEYGGDGDVVHFPMSTGGPQGSVATILNELFHDGELISRGGKECCYNHDPYLPLLAFWLRIDTRDGPDHISFSLVSPQYTDTNDPETGDMAILTGQQIGRLIRHSVFGLGLV